MKNKLILRFLAIVLMVQLTSCAKEKQAKKEEKTLHKSVASDTIFDSKNPYYIFIQKNNPEALKENKLIYFKEEDIDLDGKKEAIVALGEIDENFDMQKTVNQIFVFRNDNGIIKELDNNFDNFLLITGVDLVLLEWIKQKYICLYIIERGSSYGFTLLGLNGNKLNELFSITPLAEGSCYLIDKNNDGKFDGYVKSYIFSDVVRYEVKESYVFKDSKFKISETHVKISDYPTDIEELVLQYISLRSLHIQQSSEVKQRLKQICTDQTASAIEWNKDIWEDACLKYLDESDKSTEIEINEENNITTVSYKNEDQKQYQLQFEVEKSNNKWRITKVTVTKNGEK